MNQTNTQIIISPATANVVYGATQQFTAIATDQFGAPLQTQPTLTWSMSASPGSVDQTGLYIAPTSGGNPVVAASAGGVTGTATLTLVDMPPTLATTGSPATYTEANAPTPVDGNLQINNADTPTLSSAVVSISTNYAGGQDVLAFTNQNGITGSYSAGVLTLGGIASVADYQAALRSVTYLDTSADPDTAPRTISFVVSDGTVSSAGHAGHQRDCRQHAADR